MLEPGDYKMTIQLKGEKNTRRFYVRVWPGDFVTEQNVIELLTEKIRNSILCGDAVIIKIKKDNNKYRWDSNWLI